MRADRTRSWPFLASTSGRKTQTRTDTDERRHCVSSLVTRRKIKLCTSALIHAQLPRKSCTVGHYDQLVHPNCTILVSIVNEEELSRTTEAYSEHPPKAWGGEDAMLGVVVINDNVVVVADAMNL